VLTRLDLSGNAISALGLEFILEAEWARGLRSLSLALCPIGNCGVAALGDAPALTALADLELGFTGITDAALWYFQGAPWVPALTRLDLRGNPRLGRNPFFWEAFCIQPLPALRTLDVSASAPLHPSAASLLAAAVWLPQLEVLRVQGWDALSLTSRLATGKRPLPALEASPALAAVVRQTGYANRKEMLAWRARWRASRPLKLRTRLMDPKSSLTVNSVT
jgi:hypothetical protein